MKDDKETKEEHESYGLLQINRQTCTTAINVFGSSIKTANPVSLRIYQAEKHRNLSRTWFFPKEKILEVVMSPSQFADAIMNLNSGTGTPVTLYYVNGKRIPPCPCIDQRQVFYEEFEQDMKEVSLELTKLKEKMQEVLSKSGQVKKADRKELLHSIQMVEQNIKNNTPFVYKQFNRAMDKTVSAAKGEIEGFLVNTVNRLGKEALESQKHILQIGEKRNEP